MIRVAYSSPFIPPEWIAAHGMRPVWLEQLQEPSGSARSARRGMCHFADSLVDRVLAGCDVDAIVLTTVCDQMRYVAAYLRENCAVPIFLLNVPSTWQSPEVQQLYLHELARLGRFLESVGGCRPSWDDLRSTMHRYETARAAARGRWPDVAGVSYTEWLAELRNDGRVPSNPSRIPAVHSGTPLAIVGGPLLKDDVAVYELIAGAGGRIVLDASEWGERTLPAPLIPERVERDPLAELTRIYFQEIPDVFRRPNTRLYEWLAQQLAARDVRGILFWRRLFCDLWHAELEPMRRWSPVPVLDLDTADGGGIAPARMLGRIEAFLEMLP